MLNLTLVNKENQFQGLFDNPTDLRFFEYDFHGQKKVRELLYRDKTIRINPAIPEALSKCPILDFIDLYLLLIYLF